jgi:uncharacterized protein YhbP (UPF0306 family)
MDVEKAIREYLPGVIHMSLATCRENKPWVCEVHYVFDESLNLYFRSKEIRRHSQEIAGNPLVAGNIVEQHSLEQNPRGVYFEGKAEILNDIDGDNPVYKLFRDRFDLDEEIIEDAKSKDGHRLYKISVAKYYLFDSRESKPSQKYELNWSK